MLKDYCTVGKTLAGPNCPKEDVVQKAFLDYKRADYGGIVANDNAYLLSTMEALGACPVHTAPAAETPGTGTETPGNGTGQGTDPGTGQGTGQNGGTGTTNPGEGGTTTPTEPGTGETAATPTESGDWWNNIWKGN